MRPRHPRRNSQDDEIRELLRQLSQHPDVYLARRLVRALERQGENVLSEPLPIKKLRDSVIDGERVSGLVKVALADVADRNFESIVAERLAGGPLHAVVWRVVDVAGDNEIVVEASGDASRLVENEDEIIHRAATRRRLWASVCGLNADWSVQAWHLVLPGDNTRPNTRSGDLYILSNEDGEEAWSLVRRFYEDDRDEEVEEILSSDSLATILDTASSTLRGG
jgi:hypothetical protein